MFLQPKTDWLPTDYFNAEDWNRIRNNLRYIRDWFKEHQWGIRPLTDLTIQNLDAVTTSSVPRTYTVNYIENSIRYLHTDLGIDYPEYQNPPLWYSIVSTSYKRNPNSTDWNRWELFTVWCYRSTQALDTYSNNRAAGTFHAGNNIRIQYLSRGR